MFTPDVQWIEAFAEAIRNTMHRCGAAPNSCIEAACVGVGVAREFGFLVEPVPVAVHVLAGGQATVLPSPDGSSKRDSGFAGHLILHFPGAGMMVDLTADQFHNPKRGLLVPGPMVGPVTREQLTTGFGADLPGGTKIGYRELVGDVSWRVLPAWAEPSTLMTQMAVRELRETTTTRRRPPRRRRAATQPR